MQMNTLLRSIVDYLPIPSEAARDDMLAAVDAACPAVSTDEPADTGTPGVTVDTTKGK